MHGALRVFAKSLLPGVRETTIRSNAHGTTRRASAGACAVLFVALDFDYGCVVTFEVMHAFCECARRDEGVDNTYRGCDCGIMIRGLRGSAPTTRLQGVERTED